MSIEIFQTPRQGGKTHRLIRRAVEAASSGMTVFIVTHNEQWAKDLQTQIDETPLPLGVHRRITTMSVHNLANLRSRGSSHPPKSIVMIDNVDLVLQALIWHPITFMTLTGEGQETELTESDPADTVSDHA